MSTSSEASELTHRPSGCYLQRRDRTLPYAQDGRSDILSLGGLERALREIGSWPGYEATPLLVLRGLAGRAGVSAIYYKHEASRFGLGSFKALGGAYAVMRLLQSIIREKTGEAADARQLAGGRFAEICAGVTVTCATDGNHGRSVAWGARTFGCRCVIYVHEHVSQARCDAIASYGAEVRRVVGNYDDAVRQASADAVAHGWHVVSDTSYPGYVDVPRDVMQGYGVMVEEALAQLPAGVLPSHVFVQGGVGGLAAAVCATLWERFQDKAPLFVVVEPDRAPCLFRSAVAGKPVVVHGALDTIMAGLACGEVSILAWEILRDGADAFLTISDEAAAEAMRVLAAQTAPDQPIAAGESAVAGLAALLQASAHQDIRTSLRINQDSTILLFGTEGPTDPTIYQLIVGKHHHMVEAQDLPAWGATAMAAAPFALPEACQEGVRANLRLLAHHWGILRGAAQA